MDNKNIILIAGGSGFLGRHLCKMLLEVNLNYIICIDNLISGHKKNIEEFINNKNFIFYNIDITNNDMLEEYLNNYNINEIYNLACMASPDKYKSYPIETLKTCFNGTINLLELAKKNKSKFLFTSTSEIYGDPLINPQPEEYFGNVNTVGERSCYDEGKRVAETLIYEYNKLYNIDTKIVRVFNTYGPYMDINDGRVITNFIKQIDKNNSVIIYGDGTQTRSFCYVNDLINGIILMMSSNENGPINIGNPDSEMTLNKLVTIYSKIFNKNIDIKYIKATENDPKQRRPDISKAYQKLNWYPTVNIEEGIIKTLNYFIFDKII